MAEKFLSQDEVDALLEGVEGDQDDGTPVAEVAGVRDYNLATQARIVRSDMPALETINEEFSRLLGVELLNFLRRKVEVSFKPVYTAKYSEFIGGLAAPINLNLIAMKPLRGTALMVFDPTLVFLLVDNLFGGDGRFHTPIEGREFTQTEQRIIQRILGLVLEVYTKAWKPVHTIAFEFLRSENNTQFVNIATPNEVVLVTTFNVELGPASGEIHFCMPYTMIEPIHEVLTAKLQGEASATDKRWVKRMTQQVQAAEIEIVADLAKTDIPLGEVLNMKVGDVISLNIDEAVEAKVDGVPVMLCKYGLFNGQYALRVEKLLRSNSTEYIKGEPYGD